MNRQARQERVITSLLLFALLVVLKASSELLVDGEIDGFIVRDGIFVEQLCTLGWRLFSRRNGLVLHLARHVGDDGWLESKKVQLTAT